jgi:putative ABC transport system substrate-binding protein
LLGSAAAAWPLAAKAQQTGKVPTIGFLGVTPTAAEWTTAFVQRLRELGWVDGRNIKIEYRWNDGRDDLAAEIAAEFVRMKVEVIHVTGNASALVAKQVTSTIPIVFAVAGDPIGTGLVASLARPRGNVTGLSNQLTDAAGKRVELLRDLLPDLRRIAVMVGVNPLSAIESNEVQAAAGRLGIESITLDIRGRDDILPAIESLKGRAGALYVANAGPMIANRMRIITLALGARLPTVFSDRGWLEAGGLMSYGANFTDLFRRSGDYVDKILRGAKPADIPVEQPTKFDLAVNLIVAKAIGLTIPETFLVRATEVIE